MPTLHRMYEPATACTDGPAPGARALMAWFLGAYADLGGHNLGIYNCRAVRGGSTTSLHGEGRAVDFGVRPLSAAWGWDLANLLVRNSRALGIQCVIWDRHIWSGSHADAGWRDYGGASPHTDHLHVELSWDAARTLTPERIHEVLHGATAATPTREEGDELTPEEKARLARVESMLDLLVSQLVIGEGDPADHTTWGWGSWAGGTDERLTTVDYLRRSNVETRVARHEINAHRRETQQAIEQLARQLGQLTAGHRAPGAAAVPARFTFTGTATPDPG